MHSAQGDVMKLSPHAPTLGCPFFLFPYPRSFFPKAIVFALLMSPPEFLNLLTRALRSQIYYSNAKSLVITNEL